MTTLEGVRGVPVDVSTDTAPVEANLIMSVGRAMMIDPDVGDPYET